MVQRPKEVIEKWVLNIENLCEIDKFLENKSDEISSPKVSAVFGKANVSGHLRKGESRSRTTISVAVSVFTIEIITHNITI